MNRLDFKRKSDLNGLVDLAIKGHYPLFDQNLQRQFIKIGQCPQKLSLDEKMKANIIIQRVLFHQNMENRRTILASLPAEDQRLFLSMFLRLVERKLIGEKMILQ